MLSITNVIQPDPINNPQLLQVTCSTVAMGTQSMAPVVVDCWADLNGTNVTSQVPAVSQGGGLWIATLNLLQLGSNYYPDTTYGIYAKCGTEQTDTDYTTQP